MLRIFSRALFPTMAVFGWVCVGRDSCVKNLNFHMAELLGRSCMCTRTFLKSLASVINAVAYAFRIANFN